MHLYLMPMYSTIMICTLQKIYPSTPCMAMDASIAIVGVSNLLMVSMTSAKGVYLYEHWDGELAAQHAIASRENNQQPILYMADNMHSECI